MTDHFANCRPGDTVTVTLRGHTAFHANHPHMAWVGGFAFDRDDPAKEDKVGF